MRGPYHRDDCALPGADDQSRPFNSITRDPTGRRCAELIKPKRSGRFRCFASRCFNYSKVITRTLNRIWVATPPRPIAPGPVFGTVSARPRATTRGKLLVINWNFTGPDNASEQRWIAPTFCRVYGRTIPRGSGSQRFIESVWLFADKWGTRVEAIAMS